MNLLIPPKIQRLYEATKELLEYAESSFAVFNDSTVGWVYLTQKVLPLVDEMVSEGIAPDDARKTVFIYGDGEPMTGTHMQTSTLGRRPGAVQSAGA